MSCLEPGVGRRQIGWTPCPICGKRTRVAPSGLLFRHPSLALDWPGGRLDQTRDCGASGKPWDRVWDEATGDAS